MNRIVMKAAAAFCAAAILPSAWAVPETKAAEWINLSSWAYEDVSSFVSKGLLPESLSGVSDYTRPIKRWELCELIYSVLDSAGMFVHDRFGKSFDDCGGYPNMNKLCSVGIIDGVETDEGVFFYPENDITREDAAKIAGNTMTGTGVWEDAGDTGAEALNGRINDVSEISGYALPSVASAISNGLMTDTGSGSFEPKARLTVEQAVIIVYRMYNNIPKLVDSDNETADGAGEQTVRELGDGLEETYDGGVYRIKKDGETLMQLEADVYSKLLYGKNNGAEYIFAVNFNDKTDVYDLGTKELLYTIPYIVYRLDNENGLAYVYSSRFMPAYSGVYGMDGAELAKPEYSERELELMAENGFREPEEEYRAADGWIYYSNWNDSGHLYKVDTNGENKKLLVSGLDCCDTEYFKGMLYFKAKENGALYCTDSEGGKLFTLSESENAEMVWPRASLFNSEAYEDGDIITDINGNRFVIGRDSIYYDRRGQVFDGWLMYGEPADYTREFTEPDGGTASVSSSACILYRFRTANGGIEREKIADYPVYKLSVSADGDAVWFMNAQELAETGESQIYVYDGKDITDAADGIKAIDIGFCYDKDKDGADMSKLCFITMDEIGKGTYHAMDIKTGEITQEQLEQPRYEQSDGHVYSGISADDMKAYGTEDRTLVIEYNGTKTELGKADPIYREGSTVYYSKDINMLYGYGSSNPLRRVVNSERDIYWYDYVTGEKGYAAGDFDCRWDEFDGAYIYTTPLMQYRMLSGGGSVSVYPNKGINKYGAVGLLSTLSDVIWQNDHLYKIDKDGVFTDVTCSDAGYWVYVPNGSDEAAMSQW